jgi:hypothetical protein
MIAETSLIASPAFLAHGTKLTPKHIGNRQRKRKSMPEGPLRILLFTTESRGRILHFH